MGIRYFATNRDFGALSKAASTRKERIGMQEGGYYFVDMEAYMRFYLGEVEADVMPTSAVIRDSAAHVFKPFLERKEIGRIVICVHGFNVELFESYTWFRVLTDTMKHVPKLGAQIVTRAEDIPKNAAEGSLTAFIGFSWPSNGNVFSYPSDQREAIGSANAFGNLVARVRKAGKPVSLICHSMGNFLACHTLKGLVNKEFMPTAFADDKALRALLERNEDPATGAPKRKGCLIERYVMLAPDVERRHVIKARSDIPREAPADGKKGKKDDLAEDSDYIGPFYGGLDNLVGEVVNVYSRFDGALNISDIEKTPREVLHTAGDALSKVTFGLLDFLARNPDQKWEKRLGAAPHPLSAPSNVRSVNATEIADRKIDHSDHIDSPALARTVAEILLA